MRLELLVEHQVVPEHDELAPQDEAGDPHHSPEEERVRRTADIRRDRHRGGDPDRDIGKRQTPATRWLVVRLEAGLRHKRGKNCTQPDQQKAGDPPGIDQLGGAIGPHRRQVGERTVRQQVGEQTGGHQQEREADGSGGSPEQQERHHGDRDIADRISQPEHR